jgi:hypothetical protein
MLLRSTYQLGRLKWWMKMLSRKQGRLLIVAMDESYILTSGVNLVRPLIKSCDDGSESV